MSNHTPTPRGAKESGCLYYAEDEFKYVPLISPWRRSAFETEKIGHANAAFIVKAVNSHDMLVKALRELVDYDGTLSGWDDARQYAKRRWPASSAKAKPILTPTENLMDRRHGTRRTANSALGHKNDD